MFVDSHINELWQQVLAEIQTKLSKPSFDTWLKSTKAVSFIDSSLIICAPTNFAKEWLETRYVKMITTTVFECLGKHVEVQFVIEENLPNTGGTSISLSSKESVVLSEDSYPNMMNPKYTFDTFV